MVQSGAHSGAPAQTASRPGLHGDGGPAGASGMRRAAEDALSLRLTGREDAAGAARRALSHLRVVDEPAMEMARLLVTELVGNSVKHAGAESVGLEVIVTRSSVWAEVTDEGPGFEPLSEQQMTADDSGWGLFLVERLADRWEVSNDGARTRVSFELARA
jgi:anti-sigma regulatory factor (Ser/Thr protein kinase)